MGTHISFLLIKASVFALILISSTSWGEEYEVQSIMQVQGLNAAGEAWTPMLRPGDSFTKSPLTSACKNKVKSCTWGVLIQIISSNEATDGHCYCTSETNINKQSLKPQQAASANRGEPVLVKPKIHPSGSERHAADAASPQEQAVANDANPTKFPLKFFDHLHRIESDGTLGEGRNFENLFIEPTGTVKIGGKAFVVGALFSDGDPLNDKSYMISLEEFNKVKKEQKWTQPIPSRQIPAEELEKLVPGLEAKAFLSGAIPLKNKGWDFYSNKGEAKGTGNLYYKPETTSKNHDLSIGTLHRKNSDGSIDPAPAFGRRYATRSDNVGNSSHIAGGHSVPKSFEALDEKTVSSLMVSEFRQKMIDCAYLTPGKLGTTGYCANGVQETIKCALGHHPGNGHAYQMAAQLVKSGFKKMPNVKDPTQTPDGCVNTYDSYARPGTYDSSPGRGTSIPGFPKPKKYNNWVPYYGHIEVKVKGGAISDFTQNSTGLDGGRTEGIATISSNRYYKFTGAYCK